MYLNSIILVENPFESSSKEIFSKLHAKLKSHVLSKEITYLVQVVFGDGIAFDPQKVEVKHKPQNSGAKNAPLVSLLSIEDRYRRHRQAANKAV